MSATGRGPRSNTDPSQFFGTPHWCVHRILEALELPGGLWLEPCAGDGAIITAVAEARDDVIWHAVEYRAECIPRLDGLATVNVAVLGNFLEVPTDDRYVAAVINPPFKGSLKIIQHALDFAPTVCVLLRLGWLAPEKQSAWLRRHMPDVYILPNRPDFTGEGGDATEYAWLVFHRGEREGGVIKLLRETPLEERRRKHEVLEQRGQLQLLG